MCGTKEQSAHQGALTCTVSSIMPMLIERASRPNDDWSFLIPTTTTSARAAAGGAYRKFQDSLKAFSVECDADEATFEQGAEKGVLATDWPAYVCNPKYLETSISL
mmetsp:Transcript_1632/g.4330  ORF Transcript_1632/g.4330 Transcript_1632/m.4330 type:complete len:106 (+) Transcript_1632:532-849(+)